MIRPIVRAVLLALGGLLVLGGVVLAAATHSFGALVPIVWGVLFIIAALIERWRYKPLGERPPGPGWIETEERFVDPETGKLVTVYQHPTSGERRYIGA